MTVTNLTELSFRYGEWNYVGVFLTANWMLFIIYDGILACYFRMKIHWYCADDELVGSTSVESHPWNVNFDCSRMYSWANPPIQIDENVKNLYYCHAWMCMHPSLHNQPSVFSKKQRQTLLSLFQKLIEWSWASVVFGEDFWVVVLINCRDAIAHVLYNLGPLYLKYGFIITYYMVYSRQTK